MNTIEKALKVYRKMCAALRDADKTRNAKAEPIYEQMESIETHLIANLGDSKDMAGLVQFYNDGRDELDELDAQYKKRKAHVALRQEKLEDAIFQLLRETNSTSMRTEHGTAFTSTQTSVKVADWRVFLDYVRENEMWDLLKHAASKDAVKATIEETKKAVPGIDFDTRLQVSVRRK